MNIEIKNRLFGDVIASIESETLKEAIVKLLKQRANLRSADLRDADLQRANLQDADLRSADLRSADLQSADLWGANLRGANLRDAKNSELAFAMTSITPAGILIVWKKCRGDVIVKLRIPEEARRSNASGRKCRFEFADVLEVIGGEIGLSLKDGKTEYRAGVRVTCNSWDENRWNECSGGIHAFLTREEAEAFAL